MTLPIANVTTGQVIDPDWGNDVADAINGADPSLFVGLTLRAGSSTGTTNGSGDLAIAFGDTFTDTPYVVACNGEPAHTVTMTPHNPSSTGFTVRVRNDADASLHTGGTVRCNWVAIGHV